MDSRGERDAERERVIGRVTRLRNEVRMHRQTADELQIELEEGWYTLGRVDGWKR